jgi:HlyD family secretion protein
MKPARILFIIALLGILAGLISVYMYTAHVKALPPLSVSSNPYENGIYASGIIESNQSSGSNINIYPEVPGVIVKIYVSDGQNVKLGDPIFAIDDSVIRATVAKDDAQAKAAQALLEELKAQPRPENLAVAAAQLSYAQANLKNADDQLIKIQQSYKLNNKSVSQNTLDNAINAQKIAQENLRVAQMQYDLVKAGAWSYDIKNQENQYQAALQAYEADKALLDKYIVKAPADGTVLSIIATNGSYASPQGVYDTYTQNMLPVATLGKIDPYLAVRCYIDEILVPKLPKTSALEARMFIRGGDNKQIPLEFVRLQPYTIPNIELSSERTERVDVRVLPVIFKFKKPDNINIYPGQLVDVFIKVANPPPAGKKK